MEPDVVKINHGQNSKQVGARINIELWDQVKIRAIREGRRTGEVLDDAIRLYLGKKVKDGASNRG
jgi:hypothetical protein